MDKELQVEQVVDALDGKKTEVYLVMCDWVGPDGTGTDVNDVFLDKEMAEAECDRLNEDAGPGNKYGHEDYYIESHELVTKNNPVRVEI